MVDRLSFESNWPYLARTIRILIIVTSISLLAVIAAKFVWFLVSGPNFAESPPSVRQANFVNSKRSNLDVGMLARISPFRSIGNETTVTATALNQPDAPETELDMVLNGVRTDGKGAGVAFITLGGGAQKRYIIGESVEGLRGVVVDSIYSDGVLLSRDGRIERLSNFHDDGIGIKSMVKVPQSLIRSVPDKDEAKDAADQDELNNISSISTADLSEQLASSTMERGVLEDILSWARFDPETIDNVPGVTVFPLNSRIFMQSGLKTQDVVQAINGVALNQRTDFESLVDSFGEIDRAEISILRNRQMVKLTVNVIE